MSARRPQDIEWADAAAALRGRIDLPTLNHQTGDGVAIQPIRLLGDPVLRRPAVAVVDFDRELRNLVHDLTDTMVDAPGAGLAAPQIGVGLRVFTWQIDGELGHLVNPVLELSEQTQDGEEGCLSIPGLLITCRRSASVVAHGQNMYGEPVTVRGNDILARALQHETDHLDGVMFVDRLDPAARKVAMKQIRESEWFGDPALVVKVSPHPMF
ncbi:MAG: peptide deformylase, partial [Nocardioides sp.]